jgi:hypothetical protein
MMQNPVAMAPITQNDMVMKYWPYFNSKGCFMLRVARTQDKRIFFKDSVRENFKLMLISRRVQVSQGQSANASCPQIFQLGKMHWTVISK